MPEPQSPDERRVKGLYQAALENAKGLATHFQPGYGTKELTPADTDMLWNERALSVEQEHDLWRAVKPDGTPQFTPEEIGLQVFPKRLGLMQGGGRIEPKAQHAWVNTQARRVEKQRQQQMAGPELMGEEV